MLRLIAYLLLIAPLIAAGLWLAENPGSVLIEWQGYAVEMPVTILLGLLIFAATILLTLSLILKSLLAVPGRWRRRRTVRQYQRALQNLNNGMTALALGDYRHARRHIHKARRYLKEDPPITQLLSVQLAHAEGDTETARATFDAMLDNEQTRPIALRGKISECMAQKKRREASPLVEEAWKQRPQDRWLTLAYLDILFYLRDFDRIAQMLEQHHHPGLSKAELSHYRAMAYTERAYTAIREHSNERAMILADQAVKAQPGFEPGIILKATLTAQQEDTGSLLKYLSSAWSKQPHPTLASLFLDYGMAANASKTHKRLERLTRNQSDHLETQLLKARVAIALREWEQARNLLKVALSKDETPEIYELLAEVEIGEHGDDKKAADWLRLAVTAPKGMRWTCSHCATIHEHWQSHCENCQQFDAIIWTRPADIQPPAHAELPPADNAATSAQPTAKAQ